MGQQFLLQLHASWLFQEQASVPLASCLALLLLLQELLIFQRLLSSCQDDCTCFACPSSLLLFSWAPTTRFLFTLSITSSGFNATNFIGLPIFITIKPFFSNDSRISYVLDLGTSEILLSSPAVDTPLDKRAVQTFASYKFKSNIFLSLPKNSSLIIIV